MRRRAGTRAAVLAAIIAIAVASSGCGRKAKPEPLWSTVEIVIMSVRAR